MSVVGMSEDPNELTDAELARLPEHERRDYEQMMAVERQHREEAANEVVVRLTREQAERVLELMDRGLWDFDRPAEQEAYERALDFYKSISRMIHTKLREIQ